jgi:phenylpropionate dioxygenase-like ring-hydroxylating dioxygenase large terminal subunit
LFVNESQLEHVLMPSDYFAPEQYAAEIEHLFRGCWFVAGCKSELKHPGDFLTLELLGQPLIVRNFAGELRAFINVCAHRHCKLTHQSHGNSQQLRCQYHGWEYKADGYTAHIPDAKIFRPMDRETSRLKSIRLEVCGELVFVALDDSAPPLSEQLGQFFLLCQEWFDSSFRFSSRWTTTAMANWKVLIENSVESYHVPMVHPTSFGVAPDERICRHMLDERYSTFESDEALAWRRWGQTFLVRSIGLPVTNIYKHHLAYPNLQFVNTDAVRIVIMIVPISPTSCEQRVWVFAPQGSKRNPWAWLVRTIMRRVVVFETQRVLNEDAAIFSDVQQGLEASPHRGVIGTREERVHAFQKYVKMKLDLTR